jgi:hypothetical protein
MGVARATVSADVTRGSLSDATCAIGSGFFAEGAPAHKDTDTGTGWTSRPEGLYRQSCPAWQVHRAPATDHVQTSPPQSLSFVHSSLCVWQ